MKKTLLIIIILGMGLVGCKSTSIQLTLAHKIEIPKVYSYGLSAPMPGNTCHAERYVKKFEEGFWECVRKRSKNINYKYTKGDIAVSGHASTVEGYYTGYLTAEKMINDMNTVYGKETTHNFIKAVLECDDIKIETIKTEAKNKYKNIRK